MVLFYRFRTSYGVLLMGGLKISIFALLVALAVLKQTTASWGIACLFGIIMMIERRLNIRYLSPKITGFDPTILDPTIHQAYALLGLKPRASKEQIHHAHRHMLKTLHPDQGGNHRAAANINHARDVLLRIKSP